MHNSLKTNCLFVYYILTSSTFPTAHLPGATVRVSEAADVSGPGARRARHLRPQPAYHSHPVHRPLPAGHHLQAAPT